MAHAPRSILFALLAIGVVAGVASLRVPAPRSTETSPAAFSSARARSHLVHIARRPHPPGSAEHDRVRDYLVETLQGLALDVRVQRAVVEGMAVENVVARLSGRHNTRHAVLLAAHYDSVTHGPAAADDGAAVAGIIETLRALRAGDPTRHDVIVLFSDAEEFGLRGASAFVADHPWAQDVRVILNFEARGNSGQVLMFQTTQPSGWLIDTYANAAPQPATSSIAPLAYDQLPNVTDLDALRELGVPALNFAFFGGHPYYHSPADTIDNLAEGSLQHVGATALALARAFGNENLARERTQTDLVYFNAAGSVFTYSFATARAALLIPVGLFAWLVVAARRRRQITRRGVTAGAAVVLAAIPAAVTAAILLLLAVRFAHPEYRHLLGDGILPDPEDLLNGHLYFLALVATAAAVTTAITTLARRRFSLPDLAVGGLSWWLIATIVTSALTPAASYPFAIPLTAALLGALAWLHHASPETDSLTVVAALGLAALPTLILLTPLLYTAHLAFTLGRAPFLMAAVALITALLLPQLESLSGRRRWAVPIALATIAVALLVAGATTRGFSPDLLALLD